ncbi:MAG: response regulator [Waltera sp.]
MLRLMIVDDEQIIREALSSMIDYTSLGYEVIATAKNGMEAYDRIRDDYPDVVITDIKMPILNGLELIERASRIDSRITFILLSGYGEFEYAKQSHDIRGPLLSLKTHGQAGADQLSGYDP